MTAPNPVLGLHVSPGAAAWAHVRREPDGTSRVLDWGVERVREDTCDAVADAARFAARRPWRGRGTLLALPDASGCIVTTQVPADGSHLEGADLVRELHEATPFEPDVGTLRHRLLATHGAARDFLVAAIPSAQERLLLDAAAPSDDGSFGYGLAGAAVVRGARAAGLAKGDEFLVECLPRATLVYALDGERVRRYLVAAGAADVVAGAARGLGRDESAVRRAADEDTLDEAGRSAMSRAAEPLADDLLSVAAYHRAQKWAPKDPPDEQPAPRFVAVGPLLGSTALRRAVAATLGPRLADPASAAPPAGIAWNRPPGPRLPDLCGALGAALEALDSLQGPDRGLVLRPLPQELPAPRSTSAATWVAAFAVVAAVGAGAWWTLRDGRGAADRDAARRGTVETVTGTVAPRAPRDPLEPDVPDEGLDGLVVSAVPGSGMVRIAWPPGTARRLRRIGTSGWDALVAEVPETAGSAVDPIDGPSGVYRYHLEAAEGEPRHGAAVELRIDVPVDVALESVEGTTARFRLRRRYGEYELDATADAGPGDAVAALVVTRVEGQPDTTRTVSLDPGLRLVAARVTEHEEVVHLRVPRFRPDGRTERGPDGAATRDPRDAVRRVRVLEADLEDGAGGRRTVSRKMTDG